MLPAWTASPRKRLVTHPKFYLFDTGLTNALTHRLAQPLDAVARGRLFEQFLVLETRRRVDYARADARPYYWRTNNGAEVDLLLELGGKLALAVEFKSRAEVGGGDLSGLRALREDYPELPCLLVTTSPEPFRLGFAEVLPWSEYLARLEAIRS